MKKLVVIFSILFLFFSCNTQKKSPTRIKQKPKTYYDYGLKLNHYKVINDTVKKGETFGVILDKYHVNYTKVNRIVNSIKSIFDVRKIQAGKPYIILRSKDSTKNTQVFIYKYDKINSTVIKFKDSIIKAYQYKKPIKTVEKQVSGTIYSNFSVAIDSLHLNPNMTYAISDIYAWTLDFYKLQKNDTFKFIYQEKYVNDTIFAGYGKIKAAVFTHKNKELYAFRFVTDSVKNISQYYDENGNMLRKQFLKSPIKFRYRISSRYNLRRRIRYYGYKVRPHRGTDFAAPIGTPIMSTANGTVIASTRNQANGNYIKIRHNANYTTQYLHMKRRKVKVGDYVKQGDIIGWVGMTGYTAGPHVCYRFWKNGKQVDPFKQKFPPAKPLKKDRKPVFLKYISSLKKRFDSIDFDTVKVAKADTTSIIANKTKV